jgi:putative endopeptidase
MNRLLTAVCLLCLASASVWGAAVTSIDRAVMDNATPPGTDFWQFANGAWVKAHPIPPDRSSYGRRRDHG